MDFSWYIRIVDIPIMVVLVDTAPVFKVRMDPVQGLLDPAPVQGLLDPAPVLMYPLVLLVRVVQLHAGAV